MVVGEVTDGVELEVVEEEVGSRSSCDIGWKSNR